MRKVIFVIGVIIAVLAIAYVVNMRYTKSFSPEDVARYSNNGLSINVYYCQPSRKERLIFGSVEEALVPFGKIWRTGANEATEIEFNRDLTIEGKKLEAGRYSLFTIPGAESWTLIFNSGLDQWGTFNYDEEDDILRVNAVVKETPETIEMFTIAFKEEGENLNLTLSWDRTEASLLLEY